MVRHLTILGGGTAGLAVAYYAEKNGISFTIYEANGYVGGNCSTFDFDGFRFDSGAHRFHNKDAQVSTEIKRLMGTDLQEINIPSQVYYNGKFVEFPFRPMNLIRSLGPYIFNKAMFEIFLSRLKTLSFNEKNGSFKNFALNTYGKTVADRFLLNYSEKLWGLSCDKLSSDIAQTRLKGLGFTDVLAKTIMKKGAWPEHMEGSFYYPKMGFGTIVEKLKDFCGVENIRCNSKVTKVFHDAGEIQAIEVNKKDIVNVDEVVSTLPLDYFVKMMDPVLCQEILKKADNLHYRNILLIVFLLNVESVSKAATIYFPNIDIPFTRIYEPKNRSAYMAPPGKTSLVVEVPLDQDDMYWTSEQEKLISSLRLKLIQTNFVKEDQIIDILVYKLPYAYPVLEKDYKWHVQDIMSFLGNICNLKISGRNGKFQYTWFHDMMKYGKEIVESYLSRTSLR